MLGLAGGGKGWAVADAPVPEALSSRRAGAADLDVVFGLLATRWEEFRGRSRGDRDGWLRRLGEGAVEAWLVFEHGAPVAVAVLRPDPTRDVCRRLGAGHVGLPGGGPWMPSGRPGEVARGAAGAPVRVAGLARRAPDVELDDDDARGFWGKMGWAPRKDASQGGRVVPMTTEFGRP